MLGDPLQATQHGDQVGVAGGVGDLHVDELRPGGHAPVRAIGGGPGTGDQSGHEGAVPVPVTRPGTGQVDPAGDPAGEVGYVGDTGVHHGHGHAAALVTGGRQAQGRADRGGRAGTAGGGLGQVQLPGRRDDPLRAQRRARGQLGGDTAYHRKVGDHPAARGAHRGGRAVGVRAGDDHAGPPGRLGGGGRRHAAGDHRGGGAGQQRGAPERDHHR